MAGIKSSLYIAKTLISAVKSTTYGPGIGYLGPTMTEMAGFRNWTFIVKGITSATVTFYGCVDDARWSALDCGLHGEEIETDALAIWAPLVQTGTNGSVTADGIYTFGTSPLISVAAAVTAYASGTITVQVMAV